MRVEEFSLALETPLSTAAGEIVRREGVAVRIGGGVGEATPLPGWTESLEECREALSGIDDPEAALADLDDRPATRHALSLALMDRDAREKGVSLSSHLGGSSDSGETVPVNATVGDASPEETAEAAREAVENGFGTVKCKVGARPVDEDIERVRAIREAVGPDPALRLDANGGWSREGAAHALGELADIGIEYVEQPLAADDVAGHRDLPSTVPIALDESLAGRTVEGIEGLADAADVFVLKPMALGGIDRVVELGRRLGDVVVTTTIDAVIARTAAVHAAAALGVERACGLATADLLERDLAPDPAPVRDGAISVPTGPGLGTDGPWNGGGADA
ncbi:mandelate racemase/muconate lactonizing enzyme family protein [Halalkalicoccus sp. NIPERK01]|uniref:mandelate racemase/muconate lactonizing enzyme family protein n=1 Tax=Halalkalicoccus sp. NIPERK01 TaxID=3053469 RepID=UPI00256F4BEC|nr:enolase C-terminal domain-like protein [Halalkalicoccus sp. NIPERK01]MDL5361122.1 enolase C-terminal domain-like protein [Halalkalicoccus sp. NIPERK01]